MATHLAGERRVDLLHLGFDKAMPRLPHQRGTAEFLDPLEQRAARLNVGNDRRPRSPTEQVLGINHQELIAPDHSPLSIDCTDAIAVAVEGNSEIELLLGYKPPQVFEVLRNRGIRMVIGESPIDFGIEGEMFPGQSLHKRVEHRPCSAVSGVPPDPQLADTCRVEVGKSAKQSVDVVVEHVELLDRSRPIVPVTLCRKPADRLDVLPEERPSLKDHLEAIVVGGIMTAGYLNSAIDLFR